MRVKVLILFGFLMSSFASLACAEVLLSTKPGVPVTVHVSSSEFTLYQIDDAKIVRLDGENFIDNSVKDKGFGKAFIKPESTSSFTLFLTDDKGRTFPVHIVPDAKKKGDVVVIHDMSSVKVVDKKTDPAMSEADSHIKTISRMMQAMGENQSPMDMTVLDLNQNFSWWTESSIVLKKRYEYKGLVGQVYLLTNVSGKQMVMSNQEFYFKGAVAASIEKPVLLPGEATRVFVIKG